MPVFGLEKKPYHFMQELALRFKTVRKQARITQSQLAQRSGVSLASIKRFERTGQISLQSLLKTSEILNRLNDFDLLLKPAEDLKKIEKLFSSKTRSA